MKVSIIGRIGYDLYAREWGEELASVQTFSRYLGGSSANLAVGLARQGARPRMLSCLGTDPLSDYLVDYLRREDVNVEGVQRKAGWLPSLCLTEVSPPDRFPQVFYRDRAADTQFEIQPQVHRPLILESDLLATNGTSLCASPSRESTFQALEWAHAAGIRTALDIDYRAPSWRRPEEAALYVRLALPWTEILIGNPEELSLVAGRSDLDRAIESLLAMGTPILVAKLGSHGVRVYRDGEGLELAPLPVTVSSTIGAGDGFAAGFLASLLRGLTVGEALRRGNASAALVVQQPMCSEAMPTSQQVEDLLDRHPEVLPRQCRPLR